MERRTPRIKTSCGVHLTLEPTQTSLSTQTIDISEGGLSFELEGSLQESPAILIPAKINLKTDEISTFIQLIWTKYDSEKSRYQYGVKFSVLSEDQKSSLREMLWTNTEYILENTKKIMGLIDQRTELLKRQITDFFTQEASSLIENCHQIES